MGNVAPPMSDERESPSAGAKPRAYEWHIYGDRQFIGTYRQCLEKAMKYPGVDWEIQSSEGELVVVGHAHRVREA